MGTALVVAAGVGVAIALQVATLGAAGQHRHPLAISLGLQLAGVTAGVVWAVTRHQWPAVVATARDWWWLPLGAVGWLVVGALGFAALRLGITLTLGVSVGMQLLIGVVLDVRGGVIAMQPRQLVGALLLSVGLLLLLPRA